MSTREAIREAASLAEGAAAETAEIVRHPARARRSVRQRARNLQRRGAPMVRKQERQLQVMARTAENIIDGTLPERWALQGLTVVRKRARRYDLVGEATHRALRFANAALKMVAIRAGRFEKATQPPARPPRRRRAA